MRHKLNKDALARYGYHKFQGVFSQNEINEWIAALELVIADQSNNDVCRDENRQYASGVDQLSRQPNPLFLQLTAHPYLQPILDQIYSEEYTIIQEFAVTKMLAIGSQVNWHRDIHPQRWDGNYMMGIYLHDSAAEEGALRIIPNSHYSSLDICELQNMPCESIAMQAGDILIHDMRLAHGSPGLTYQDKRYVIYLEITTTKYAAATYGEQFVERRELLKQLSVQACSGKYSQLTREDRLMIYPDVFKPLPSLYCLSGFV